MRAVLIINSTASAQKSRVALSLPALNRDAHFSSLLINVLGCIFLSQNRVVSSALKTCSGRCPISSMIFLMASGNLSAASWSAEDASPVVLTVFKQIIY